MKLFPNLRIPYSVLATCSMNSERFDHLMNPQHHYYPHSYNHQKFQRKDQMIEGGVQFYPTYENARSPVTNELRCSNRDRLTCSSTVGCEWCLAGSDNEAAWFASLPRPLNQPFCAVLGICYNGLLGSISPYENYRLTDKGMY